MTPCIFVFYHFLASSDFCRLLITFANSLDPDQDRQNVGPDEAPKLFDTLIVLLGLLFENGNFGKKSTDNNKSMKITQHLVNVHLH